jgi:hypothetical protein
VTRANITYARFMEASEYLSICYRSCREIMQHAAVLTRDDSPEAIQWRQDVAYKTILLLRVTMASVEVRIYGFMNVIVCRPTMLFSIN